MQAHNIRMSGESPDFFAEYKVRDVAVALGATSLQQLKLLEFGVGVGNSLPHFRKYFPAATIVGADVSRRSLKVATERFPGHAALVEIDGAQLPFADQSFDFVFVANVFHHIDRNDHAMHFRNLLRVLRPRGSLFLFEHNPYNPLTLYAVNTCPFDKNAHLITPGAMRRRLAEAGFVNIRVSFRIFFPRLLHVLRPMEKWLTRVPLGAQYCAVASAGYGRVASN